MAADRRRDRQEALVRTLEPEGLDGLVVTSHANIRYLTGFSGSAAVVVVTRADVLLVTDFRYDAQARGEAGAVARIEVDSTSVWDRFFKELATLGPLTTLGYEAHALSVHDAERFAQAGKAWRWIPTTELVERLRAVKDEGEVAAIRSAALLAGEALRQTLAWVRRGIRALAGSRTWARGARSAPPLEDQPRSPPRGRRGHDRARRVFPGRRRCADRRRRASRSGGARAPERWPDGPLGARVTL